MDTGSSVDSVTTCLPRAFVQLLVIFVGNLVFV